MSPSKSKKVTSVPARKSTEKRPAVAGSQYEENHGRVAVNNHPRLPMSRREETDGAALAEDIDGPSSLEMARNMMLRRFYQFPTKPGYLRPDSENTKVLGASENDIGPVYAKSIVVPNIVKGCDLKTKKAHQGRASESSEAVASTSESDVQQEGSPSTKRYRRTISETIKAGRSSSGKQQRRCAASSSAKARTGYRKTFEVPKAGVSISGTEHASSVPAKSVAKATIEYPIEEFLYDGDVDDYTLQRNKTIPYNVYIPRAVPPDNVLPHYRCPTSTYYHCTACATYIKDRGPFIEHIQFDCKNQYSCQCQHSTYNRRLMLTHIKKVHGNEEDKYLEKLTIIRLTSDDPDTPTEPPQFIRTTTCTPKMAKRLAKEYMT